MVLLQAVLLLLQSKMTWTHLKRILSMNAINQRDVIPLSNFKAICRCIALKEIKL